MAKNARFDEANLPLDDLLQVRRFAASWDGDAKPVLFAGAGLSTYNAVRKPTAPKEARLKDWNGLKDDMLRGLVGGDLEAMRRMSGDPLRVAELYVSHYNSRGALLDLVDQALPVGFFDPGPAHKWLARLPWAAIVTTNYDDLIERALEATDAAFSRIVHDDDLTRFRKPGSTLVIKMHGDFLDRESIVLSEDDYLQYEKTRPGIAVKVRQLLLEHPVLFVGFSLSDPNVGRLLGWVRDTVGRLSQPSLTLVHNKPLSSEGKLWASRGVHLIALSSGLPLQAFAEALHNERYSPPEPTAVPKSQALQDIENVLGLEVAARESGWERRVGRALLRLAELARQDPAQVENARDLVDTWCTGLQGPGDLPAEVYGSFDARELQEFLLFASTARSHVIVNGFALDLLLGLIVFGAFDDETRAELMIRWWSTKEPRARLDPSVAGEVARWLGSVRASVGPALRSELDITWRDAVYFSMDEAELLRCTEATWDRQDAAFTCRRAADYLWLGDTSRAAELYQLAHDRAHGGDERFAALWGRFAVTHDYALLDEARAIPERQRPLISALSAAWQGAGRQLLKEGPARAVNELLALIAIGRQVGLPASAKPWQSFDIDDAAAAAVEQMLAGEDPASDEIKTAFLLSLQAGVPRGEGARRSGLVAEHFETLGRAGVGAWVRRELAREGGAPRVRSARIVLTLRAADLVDDATLSQVAAELGDEAEALAASGGEALSFDAYEQALHFARQRLPVAAVMRFLAAVPSFLLSAWHFRGWFDVVDVTLLPQPHTAYRETAEVHTAVRAAIDSISSDDGCWSDYVTRRPVVDLLARLHRSSVVREEDTRDLLRAIERRAIRALEEQKLLPLLDALWAIVRLDPSHPIDHRAADALVASLERERNATSSSDALVYWLLPRALKDRGDPAVLVRALGALRGRVESTRALFRHDACVPRLFGGAALARAIASIAELVPDEIPGSVQAIEQLADVEPEASLELGRPELGVAGERIARVEARLYHAVLAARSSTERRSAVSAVLRWCEYRPEISPHLVEMLPHLVLVDPGEARISAISGAAALVRAGKMPPSSHLRVAEVALRLTEGQHRWMTRANAAYQLRAIAKGTVVEAAAEERVEALKSDPVTIVRRAAQAALEPAANLASGDDSEPGR